MKQRLIYLYLTVISLGVFFSCSSDSTPNPDPDPVQAVGRTVLVYIAGDNSLSSYGPKNLEDMVSGMAGIEDNLIVYTDLTNEGATLYKIEGDGNTKTIIEKYGTEDSATPEVLQRVWNTTLEKYPAQSYGLVLWSHGTGWVPSNLDVSSMYSQPSSDYLPISSITGMDSYPWHPLEGTLMTKSFAQDGQTEMDIEALASVLPQDRKLDFLIFDACFMSCVEVAYDLRNAAQYIIASPTEIMADGFPYKDVVPLFFKSTLDLQSICSAFVDYYRNLTTPEYGGSASIALVRTSEMDALASATREVFALNPSPEIDISNVQYLELLSNHVFYDLEDYLSQFASGTSQFEAFQQQLAKTVIYTDHTDGIYSAFGWYNGGHAFPCTRFCGLSTYIPRAEFPVYNAAYLQTAWAQTVGIAL